MERLASEYRLNSRTKSPFMTEKQERNSEMSSVKAKGKRITNVFLADFTTSVDRASNGTSRE
jgi:hypothetical protein